MRLFLLTALTLLCFAANSILNRWAVAGDLIGAVEFAGLRLLAGTVMLLALLALRPTGSRQAGGFARRILGAAGLLVYLLAFSLAYEGLDAASGALVLFGAVQVTMFAGALTGGEAVPPRRWAGSGLALAGLALIAAPGQAALPPGPLALMAAAGAGFGVFSLVGRRGGDPLRETALTFALALLPGLAAVAVLASGLPVTAPGVALAVLSGAVTTGLGYALWYSLLPALGAARAAVAQLSVPVLAAAMGALILAEMPDLRFAAASALVLGGVALGSLTYRVLPRRSSQ